MNKMNEKTQESHLEAADTKDQREQRLQLRRHREQSRRAAETSQ